VPDGYENPSEKRPLGLFLKHIARKIFLEDWMMKLIALAITLGLWFGVTGLSTPVNRRLTGIPLSLRYSNNIEVTNSPVQEVDVVIAGDKRRVDQVDKADLSVSVDISDIQPGDRVLVLTPESVNVSLPAGIKLEEILPNRIAVRVEAVEEKEVPVQAETEGQLPEGLEIYSQMVVPPTVRVRGPSSFIRSLTSVSTERIDLSDRTSDFIARQVPVNVSNPKSTVLEGVVDITFRIGEARVERSYSVPVEDEPGKHASVVLYGGRSLFENVRAEDMRIETVKNDAGVDTARLVLPPVLEGRVEVRKLKIN
jgi:hypothetical protein